MNKLLCDKVAMEELLAELNSEFDDAEGWIRIVDADWFADDLKIKLSVLINDESEPDLWQLTCSGVVEESICSESFDSIYVLGESALLKPYSEEHADLMFADNSCDPAQLLGIICSCCVEVFGRLEYVHRFLNQRATLEGIVSSKYGLLGRFPLSLAKRIEESFERLPIRVNVLDPRMPRCWTGTEFVPYPKLMVLELGNSFVIGEGFNAVRA
ncbi:hypothetical protein [Parathalassolituus penaei]|nr:hypothetical protein [Parathalassolituus penaei]